MSFSGSNASTALAWVREDLDKLLNTSRLQIEHSADNPKTGDAALDTLTEGLEHLRLTFEALSIQGAVMLIQEMLALVESIRDHPVGSRDEAFQALMDAVVVLPSYLDRIQTGHRDMPMLLLQVMNGLRKPRNGPLLQDRTVFAPDLDVSLPDLGIEDQEATREESFEAFATRVRQQYENAMLNWLQEQESTEHLSPIQGICETLLHRVQREDQRRLWWVASEVIGGLNDGYTKNDAQLRRLFARLHLVLKTLSKKGEQATDQRAIDALTRAFLYQVSQTPTGNAGIDLVRERFGLDRQLASEDEQSRARGTVSGRNREMYASLGTAVQEELAMIKDALDLELRTGEIDTARRDNSLEALSRLQDTVKMLGLAASANALAELIPAFEASADVGSGEREASLMSLASRLLLVESALNEQIETLGEPLEAPAEPGLIDLPAHEIRRIYNHLLDEMVASLYQFQEAVKARFAGDASADLAVHLQQVAGALELIEEQEPARLTRRLATVTEVLLKNAYAESAVPPAQLEAFTDAVAALELFLAACRDQQASRERFAGLLAERLDSLPDASEALEQLSEVPAEQQAEQPVDLPAELPEQPPHVIETVAEAAEATDAEALPPEMDPELREVFLEEYDSVVDAFNHLVPDWLDKLDSVALLTDIRRGFHTLKGSGRMVGAHELGDFCWQIEDLLNHLLEKKINVYADVAVMVRLAQASLPALKQRLLQQPAGLSVQAIAAIGRNARQLTEGGAADWAGLHEQLPTFLRRMLPEAPEQAGMPEAVAGDDPAVERMRRELSDNLAPLQTLLEAISNSRATRTTPDHLRAVHTVAEALAIVPEGKLVEIAQALEALLEAQSNSGEKFSLEAVWAVGTAIEHIQARLGRLKGQVYAMVEDDEQELLDQIISITAELETPEPGAEPASGEDDQQQAVSDAAAPQATVAEPEAMDEDIVSIFLEEANEVLGRADSLLNNWRDNLDQLGLVQSLQREIHTFKGGARMSGLGALGDLSHAMESLLERIAGKSLPPSISAIQALETACDQLQDWIGQVRRGKLPAPGTAVALFEQQVQDLLAVPVQPKRKVSADSEPREPQALPEALALSNRSDDVSGQGQIRVAADLLDSLVNAASEVSILRSRMEQQTATLRSGLGEFDQTVARLREQFRKLEIETEAQIRSRYTDAGEAGTEGFDPLELDRFSSMQQLSRGLSESVSDLLSLQEMLEAAARQSESLLTQQSRFATELQEGLMQTRMVPFGSISTRLRRVVRSAANETRKRARLQMTMVGSSDQLDRNILERITAPLEHMLRNSIAHGIETPEERKKQNKNPEGEITVTVESETTEFIIRIADDGAGINLDAIRSKAIELGMIAEDANPPDQQLLEFILDSGFTTSSAVTGLAGRGVGMDVVSSEIKQIGGSLEISSETGKGSCFTIRIPFTLAVMQAIGVLAGENQYLIPLASVGGVARLLPDDYRKLLEQEEPVYEFAGERYPVLELETLLAEPVHPLGNVTISLLMISSGENRAAFRVPQLLGHREIVLKPVGPQISSVTGILGGTVTADGKVVVILDIGPLIRHALLRGVRPVPVAEWDTRPSQALAMVVDDSITMRKVTSRVLESHNFAVMTAKDGVDATEQMQDRIPDLLLLDIEMPRMDGYEVAEYVRSEARLRHIPIVMITSRSGQKHRERATRAGANAYLTKPYKESELVSQVNQLLGREE